MECLINPFQNNAKIISPLNHNEHDNSTTLVTVILTTTVRLIKIMIKLMTTENSIH